MSEYNLYEKNNQKYSIDRNDYNDNNQTLGNNNIYKSDKSSFIEK
ncbi:MAG: hypothetical protein WC850_04095 [Candidatus Gracilibacteria bacterium]